MSMAATGRPFLQASAVNAPGCRGDPSRLTEDLAAMSNARSSRFKFQRKKHLYQ
jgi:hypothetical protein